MKEDLLKGLTEEQKNKARNCKNPEEILALAKEEGIELTDEQLDSISGGCFGISGSVNCPICNSDDVMKTRTHEEGFFTTVYTCRSCGHEWF